MPSETNTVEEVPAIYPADEPSVAESTGMTVNLAETPDSERPYLPQRVYTLVLVAATFGKSKSSGNGMITLEWEVVQPKNIEFQGNTYTVEGTKLVEYASLQPQALGKLKALHQRWGLPMNLNLTNPNTRLYLGKALTAVVNTKQEKMLAEGTPEAILAPDGKPICNNKYNIVKYQAAAPEFDRVIPY